MTSRAPTMHSAWRDASPPSTVLSVPDQLLGVCFGARCGCDKLREIAQRVGHVGSIVATVATSQIDRAQQSVRTLEVIVDDEVLVFGVVLQFFQGLADPEVDHLGSIGRALSQARREG